MSGNRTTWESYLFDHRADFHMAAPACSLCGALVPTGLPAASSSSSSESSVKVAVVPFSSGRVKTSSLPRYVLVRAAAKEDEKQDSAESDKSTTTSTQQQSSFFTSITDALDFAETRSEKDAELLNDARRATQSGDQMSREQVGNSILLLHSSISRPCQVLMFEFLFYSTTSPRHVSWFSDIQCLTLVLRQRNAESVDSPLYHSDPNSLYAVCCTQEKDRRDVPWLLQRLRWR